MELKIKAGDIVVMKEGSKDKYKVISYIYAKAKNGIIELLDLKDLKTNIEYYEVPVEKVKIYLPEFK